MSSAPRAVFLDRDGTIMEDAHYIKSPARVRLLPGAAPAVKRLNDAGVLAIVVTNQSGIGRGLISVADYEAVRNRFHELLGEQGAHVDASYYCPERPDQPDPTGCRKPATKMFEDAIRDFSIDPETAAYIGDRWRDVAASIKLGGRAIMIDSPMTTHNDRRQARENGIDTVRSLGEAVDLLLGLPPHGSAP